jgi:hypothetical protein
MAEWKKIIVSGSGVSLLSNDSGYLTSYGSVEQHSDVSDAGSGIIISGAERSKLSGIEANATADQTDAEIRAAVEAATDSNVFTDADHSKLNAIEASATADQTDAEIRAAVEAATDSNVFTDADHSKLNAIEASADVTDATNVTAAGALMDSEVTNLADVKAFDKADYATAAQGALADTAVQPGDSVTTLSDVSSVGSGAIITTAERGSIASISALNTFTGSLNANFATDAELSAVSGALATTVGTKLAKSSNLSDLASAGTARTNLGLGSAAVEAASSFATSAQGGKADSAIQPGDSVADLSDVSSAGSGAIITSAERSKLNAIEASADVTDATNVTAAGALMDSEVTNLAQVKDFDSADYATAAQGTKADAALPKTGGAMTGAITTNSTFDGRDVATDGAKLDGIESGATADQSASEIRDAVEAATDSNVFTDADHSKLNAIEAGADVTDKGNVVAALGQNLGTTLTIGDSTDTITIGNDLVVTGDLTVSGNTTTIDVANLNVKDQFINLNDGGAAADGGLVVEGAGVSFGWDNSEDRWAFDALGATEGQTSITSDAFAAAVVTTDDAKYRKNGNIRVTAGEIFIYTE